LPDREDKSTAALSWLTDDSSTPRPPEWDLLPAILLNWNQDLVHEPVDIHVEQILSALGPLNPPFQRAGRLEVRSQDWPEDFFEQSYGSLKENPLERLPPGVLEHRDPVE
jgi:hypothetical protein